MVEHRQYMTRFVLVRRAFQILTVWGIGIQLVTVPSE